MDGKTVKLADLAIFSLGVHCKGADDAESCTVQNIRSFSFNARGTGKMSAKQLLEKARFKELDQYSV